MIPTKGPMMRTNAPRMNNQGLPTSKLMNALNDNPTMNVRSNIIAGPNALSYFNHSPGAEMPEIREEGSFPVQGSIGSLVADEGYNYALCSEKVDGITVPDVGGSPSCSGVFRPDAYTHTNTCGANCSMYYPSSYGDKPFGHIESMPWNQQVTNAHQLHAYENVRATAEGESDCRTYSSIDWVPNVSCDNNTGTSYMNGNKNYQQVGDWTRLPQYANLVHVRYE